VAFKDFSELHGDRLHGDDQAIVGGFAEIGPFKVVVLGTQKGRDTKENIRRNFGSAHPEGYRKALRLMRLADKFGLPIVTLIDTAGAYPGVGAEERHIAEAIAVNLREMMLFEVPIVATVIGEGGSGGALGIGVADRVLILENAYYSVISPEGCASILWKDRSAAGKAAEALKITARQLDELKLVDEVVAEPLGGAHNDHAAASALLQDALIRHLQEVSDLTVADRLKQRYAKYRAFGHYREKQTAAYAKLRLELDVALDTICDNVGGKVLPHVASGTGCGLTVRCFAATQTSPSWRGTRARHTHRDWRQVEDQSIRQRWRPGPAWCRARPPN
jgi:acetyl-CoA carboxylase carboxyl transferase subunit alpha